MTPAEFRAFRHALGWSQSRMALETGLSLSSVKAKENGRKPVTDRDVRVLELVKAAGGSD